MAVRIIDADQAQQAREQAHAEFVERVNRWECAAHVRADAAEALAHQRASLADEALDAATRWYRR